MPDGPERACRRVGGAVVVGAVLLGLLAAAGCSDADRRPPGAFPGDSVPTEADVDGATVTRVASVQEMATGLVSDSDRQALYVATRGGRIFRVPILERGDVAAPDPDHQTLAIDLSASVSVEDERGFFDMEVLEGGDRVAVSYTAEDGAVTVRLLRFEGSELLDDVEDPTVIEVPHAFAGHNGGGLALAPNGDLLLSLGDMDSREFAVPFAQDPTSLLGGVVRLPADALRPGGHRPVAPAPSLLVAKGLRNPWRIAVDAVEDELWIGDVGQDRWEEIDRLSSISVRTEVTNFGWPLFEGDEPFMSDAPRLPDAPIVGPVYQYAHGEDRCSVSLGVVYRGKQLPHLNGALLFGDLCSGDVYAADVNDAGIAAPRVIVTVPGSVVAFGRDSRGEAYILTIEGDVFRLDPSGWSVPDVAPTERSDSPEATPPTEPPSATQEECRLIEVLEVSTQGVSPDQLQSHLMMLIGVLDRAAASAPPERRADLQTLQRVFGDIDAVAKGSGYDSSSAPVVQIMGELVEGRGRAHGFPDAMAALMSVADSCP